MRILGIDPGTQKVGYGLIENSGKSQTPLDYGVFSVSQRLPFSNRLEFIYQSLNDYIEQYLPDIIAVEEVFVCRNAKTTLRLGHARGIILLAAVQKKISIVEYAPRVIKQAVVGNGSASKTQVQWMISHLLNLPAETLQEDAADALSAALCCAYRNGDQK